jgi:uncharacterized protein
MPTYRSPGVYREEYFVEPAPALRTAVPAFLGYATRREPGGPASPPVLARWPEFLELFEPPAGGFLAQAVHGFFQNGGELCYVVALASDPGNPGPGPLEELEAGLRALESLTDIDLVCAPDVMREVVAVLRDAAEGHDPEGTAVRLARAREVALRMQAAVLRHCDRLGNRFTILDSIPGAAAAELPALQRAALQGRNGALYFPWLRVADEGGGELVPPCGHVAGVYARTDGGVGVHKAPANERLEGVLDLEVLLTDARQAPLNEAGINCLRSFPGRGIRVWGARTLSGEPAWLYVNVRRLFLTAGRWIERNLQGATFEPNDFRLRSRITRDLGSYFSELYRRGALQGRTAQEAFYVRCDAALNPPEVREAGVVVAEIGLAPALPNEFVVVRITRSASGISLTGPARPA